MKSRVQTLWIPDMESYEPYVRSLCHMARALENTGRNYGTMKRVVVIGMSKRSVESYVKQLLNSSTLPNTLVCYGIDESPVSHKEFTFSGAHIVLMHDLRYACHESLGRVAGRVVDIIDSLKQKDGDKELKNTCLSVVYQIPSLWSNILEYGANSFINMGSKHVEYRSGLVSSVSLDALMKCYENKDYHELHAEVITIGKEFLCVQPDELLNKVGNLLWSLASTGSKFEKTHKIVFHEDFRRLFFEEYILRDFRGF
ncbi:hypothetical protein MPK66_gp248 [Erwinia phage pEa_SNUABM_2]|uniref:Uncharacterized protein n=1 Tax=Erwinia phage pEa_SNUABM_2 TaxID=2869547 RepID=A0AAE7XQ14_9CAUD|nr:hypothetical protein MPK66_gp248 [Erwinia phage pEa_SNUABM_2]QZE59492.1 hypothetical protein pEaSNUABM2_00248 [Erwinia phage pEa_SNUABM_2]QZE59828.1 hypothetical protein pEaSNUABM39_00248 [Erwinia phage pEa_SNUABM_39]